METGLLSYRSRKEVVKILVSYLIETYGRCPETHVKLRLAKAIVEQFPKLDNADGDGYQVWFSPGHGNHDATGYLDTRLRNVRRRYKVTEKGSASITKPQLTSPVHVDLISDEVTDEDCTAMKMWLKNHTAPKDQVIDFMRKTCKSRAVYISKNKLSDIMQEYPRLLDFDGMIDQDFRILYPDTCDALFFKWPKICDQVIQYAEKQVNWRKLLNFTAVQTTENQKINASLQLLPLLFPTGSSYAKKDGKTKTEAHASTNEACKAFIQFSKIGTNLPQFLDEVTVRQPFVLILGNRRDEPEQSFVIIERQALPCKTLLQAVDRCFKTFYILDVNYPWQCLNTWDFLQKVVFALGKKSGKANTNPSVLALKNFLKANRV